MTNAFKSYVSVVEFATQHDLHYQGFNGILVMKGPRNWMIMFPNGDAYWNGHRLAEAMIPQIDSDRLLMPKAELEQAFEVPDTEPPALAPEPKNVHGADLFVVGGPEFPKTTKYRDEYVAYPVNDTYDGNVFHRTGPQFNFAIETPDMRPKVILRLAQEEIATLAERMTFSRADMLIFRNRAWVMIGTLNAVKSGHPAKADYLAVMRVKGGKYQLKVSLSFR